MVAQNWNDPTTASLVEDVITMLRRRTEHLGQMDYTDDTNIPTNFKRYNSTNNKFEGYDGSTWTKLGFHNTIDDHIADTSIHGSLPPGMILPYGGTADPVPPDGWLLCDGTAVSRSTYAALFTVIGTAFGAGNGSTTFNLPNMRGRFPLGRTTSGTGSTLGGTGGSLDHVHTGPSHTHTMNAHTHTLSAHTHTAPSHQHTIPNHTHLLPAHYHSTQGAGATIAISVSSGAHAVQIPARRISPNATVASGSANRFTRSTNDAIQDLVSVTADNHTHDHTTFTGLVGNVSSANNGDAVLSSGDAVPSGQSTGAGGNSATTGPSTDATGSTTSTMNASGTGNTGTANPPFVSVNYLIKT